MILTPGGFWRPRIPNVKRNPNGYWPIYCNDLLGYVLVHDHIFQGLVDVKDHMAQTPKQFEEPRISCKD